MSKPKTKSKLEQILENDKEPEEVLGDGDEVQLEQAEVAELVTQIQQIAPGLSSEEAIEIIKTSLRVGYNLGFENVKVLSKQLEKFL